MNATRAYVPPILPRETTWTAERISALSLIEMRQLLANAERLGESEIAALCAQAIKNRPRPVAAQKGKPKAKPAPRKIPAPATSE